MMDQAEGKREYKVTEQQYHLLDRLTAADPWKLRFGRRFLFDRAIMEDLFDAEEGGDITLEQIGLLIKILFTWSCDPTEDKSHELPLALRIIYRQLQKILRDDAIKMTNRSLRGSYDSKKGHGNQQYETYEEFLEAEATIAEKKRRMLAEKTTTHSAQAATREPEQQRTRTASKFFDDDDDPLSFLNP